MSIYWNMMAVIVTLIVSICIPHTTAKRNNEHGERMWRLDRDIVHKGKVLDEFVRAAADYATHRSESNLSKYTTARAVAMRYIDEPSASCVQRFDEAVRQSDRSSALQALDEFAKLNRENIDVL